MMEDKKYIKFDIPEWVNWLARDKSGALYGYRLRPIRCYDIWGSGEYGYRLRPIRCYDIWGSGEYVNDTSNSIFITEDPNHFPQVKWSDEEPTTFKDGITVTDIEADDLTDEKAIYRGTDRKTLCEVLKMKKYERHSEITNQLNEIYIAKNTDYGDAFGDTFKKLGIISAVTRIVDKTNRLMSLSAKTEAERNVKDETIKDTLMDLANYAIMTLIEMEELE